MRIFFTVVTLLTIFTALPAMACECDSRSFTNKASEANIERAELIVEGEIMRVTQAKEETDTESEELKDKEKLFDPYSKVELKITEFYKGSAEQSIEAYMYTKTSCGFAVESGTKGLFQFSRDSQGRLVSPSLCESYISKRDRRKLERGGYLE